MNSHWFLGGMVVALLILLFDKPLAAQITQDAPFLGGGFQNVVAPTVTTKMLPPNSTGAILQSTSCCGNGESVSPATPILNGVAKPAQPLPPVKIVQPARSPAPISAVNPEKLYVLG
jgi:hypothetical protein